MIVIRIIFIRQINHQAKLQSEIESWFYIYDTLKVAKSASVERALADGYDPVLSRHFDR